VCVCVEGGVCWVGVEPGFYHTQLDQKEEVGI